MTHAMQTMYNTIKTDMTHYIATSTHSLDMIVDNIKDLMIHLQQRGLINKFSVIKARHDIAELYFNENPGDPTSVINFNIQAIRNNTVSSSPGIVKKKKANPKDAYDRAMKGI
jgi:hypothetical protein